MKFVCVYEIDKTSIFSATATFAITEKLFIPAGQYEKWAALKNKADRALFEEW